MGGLRGWGAWNRENYTRAGTGPFSLSIWDTSGKPQWRTLIETSQTMAAHFSPKFSSNEFSWLCSSCPLLYSHGRSRSLWPGAFYYPSWTMTVLASIISGWWSSVVHTYKQQLHHFPLICKFHIKSSYNLSTDTLNISLCPFPSIWKVHMISKGIT